MSTSAVVFYVSGHGLGHASRQIEVMHALAARRPDTHLRVRTPMSRWVFDVNLRAPFHYARADCDPGVVQSDSLDLDVHRTMTRAADFYATLDRRTSAEARILEAAGAQLVVGDVPPLAFAAAARAGIPAIVVGNFTWDWIYADYAVEHRTTPDPQPAIRAAYAAATEVLRLPLWGGFEHCSPITDIPFIARHSARDPRHTRRALRLPLDRPIVLVSFGGHGVHGLDLEALDCLRAYCVVCTGGQSARGGQPGTGGSTASLAQRSPTGLITLDERALTVSDLRYEDLVAAADVVVTKPGFGIIAECIANDTAMLYTTRGHFAEYDVLVAELPRYVRCAHVDRETLLAGRWRAPLDRLVKLPKPATRPRLDGAQTVAHAIIARLDSGTRGGRSR